MIRRTREPAYVRATVRPVPRPGASEDALSSTSVPHALTVLEEAETSIVLTALSDEDGLRYRAARRKLSRVVKEGLERNGVYLVKQKQETQ